MPDGLVLVELADQLDGTGRSIVLQARLGADSEQDRELGMDAYCLSDELGRSVYDAVVACQVGDGLVRLELSDTAVALGFDRTVHFGLETDPGVVGMLCSALALVLGKYGAAGPPELDFPATAAESGVRG